MVKDTLLTITEVVEIGKTTRPTAINWLKNWEVDGLPLGIKRGGRWMAHSGRLIKFLQGKGNRRPRDKKNLSTDEATPTP